MAFSWGGGGDEGESPASSTSEGGEGTGNDGRGRGFWLGGGGGNSDRSEDESDNGGAYGLFNNDFTGYPSTSTSDGLSLDFWSIDDIKPMNLVGGSSSNTNAGPSSARSQLNEQYEDPLMKARKEMLLGGSPDAMETFDDDLAGFGAGPTPTTSISNAPSNAFTSSNTPSNVFGLYSGSGTTAGNMQGLDPSSLFGNIPSSVFASPSASSNEGVNLQDLLGIQQQPQSSTSAYTGFNGQNMIGQQYHQLQQQQQQQQQQQGQFSGPSSLISPQTMFQQLSFSSGASNPTNSSSSRDSSSDPPGGSGLGRRQSSSASTTGDPASNTNTGNPPHHHAVSPKSSGQTSSASTTRTGTAANSPPSQQQSRNTVAAGLRQSKSGSSLVSQGDQLTTTMENTSSHNMATSQSHNGSSMLSMPDKALQQQAAETTGVVKHVVRDNTLRAPDGSSICQLLVLGLPDEGARSRVETQVKVGLILLRPKARSANQAASPAAMNYKDPKGALTAEANSHFDKVGNWRYIALPAVSSVKRRARKHFKENISPEETLFADIKVVSASVPSREIAICQNCQQREVKRQQRKTQNRSKPSGDIDSGREDEEGLSEDELAKRKIVLFNCGQYLDFASGETVIPTRITCYCRHHKEKYGFNITYTLTDHLGNVVATAMSPPIFLTDDHKAKPTRPDDVDLNHIPSLARVANGPLGSLSQRNSAWNSAASSMPSSAASSQASSVTSSAAPSRSNSVENLDELHQNANSSHSSKARKDRSAKPYNLESRPHKPKRTNSLNRLNSFTMTPMNLSAPGSPRLSGLSPLTSTSQLPPEYLAMSSASLQTYGDMLQSSTAEANNLNTLPHDHQSPHSSLSAPSTPGAGSLDSFSASLQSQTGLHFPGASGSLTSTSDEQASTGSRSVEQSPMYPHLAPLPPLQQSSLSQHLASLNTANANALNQQPRPRISRIIPNEGPTHGGTEVIILGDNFTSGLEVTFGETPAVSAQAWGGNTLVCVLPPSPSPGPVVVAFKGLPLAVNDNTGLQLFTYVDTSDKALMELALQVVGMKMSGGRIEDARNVARRIIGAGGAGGSGFPQANQMGQPGGSGFMQASTGVAIPETSGQFLAMSAGSGTRDFQAMIIKLLSVLDVDYSDSSPDLPSNPLYHLTEQKHTLLHLAAMLGFHRLVSWLIERDAALNMQDKHGYTPLHLAALSGRVTITRLLLQAGAIHDSKNQAGQTPVDIARERDQIDVEALFTRHTPSRSASSASLSTPLEIEPHHNLPTRPRSPQERNMFALPSESSFTENSDSDSDWSGNDDDEAHFASESELESHISRLSRVASAASLNRELPVPDDDETDSGVDVRSVGSPPHDNEDSGHSDSASSAWLPKMPSARLLSKFRKLKLPTPPSIASWRGIASAAMSSSPSAASLSLSSQHSTPTTVPDSEAESPIWPSSLLQAAQASASVPLKLDNAGMRATLSRALGYSIDQITEDALRSYSYHAQKYGGTFRRDKMLYFFWLPLFLIAMIWVYCQASAVVMSTLGILKEAVITKAPVFAIL